MRVIKYYMEHAIACFVHRPNSNQGIMVMSSSIFIRISTRIIVDFGRILLINKNEHDIIITFSGQ